MPINIRWLASPRASCYYAAAALAERRPLVSSSLADALEPCVTEVSQTLSENQVPCGQFWLHLVALSHGIHNPRQLSQTVLAKTVGRDRAETLAERLVNDLIALERAYRTSMPDLDEELPLRVRPIREQWEARGPGLLSAVERLTEPGLLVEQADVFLIDPACGGGGMACAPYNAAVFEALLANPYPELPEVVRLGWLLSALNQDLPRYNELLPAARMHDVGGLALVPPLLAAAETVELCQPESIGPENNHLDRALAAWGLSERAIVAEGLHTWWATYQENRPVWGIALAALDKILESGT